MPDEPLKHELEIIIVNPDKVVYEGIAKQAFAPGPFGEIALLPGHTPIYTELVEGKLIIEEKNGKKTEKKIDGGVVRMKKNIVKILVGF